MLEREVQQTAQRIADAGAKERPRLYHLTWWIERVLDRAMAHPEFKTQLFRFVDVFPACRDDADVLAHLREYFEGVDVPPVLRRGFDAADRLPAGARATAAVTRRNILRMAGQFIAGRTPAEAIPKIRRLWMTGEATSVDLLGEKTVTAAEADAYADRVCEMLDELHDAARAWPANPRLTSDPWGPIPHVNISVKPTALAPHFAPLTREDGLREAIERLEPICARARELGATVHLDMEHYDAKELTHELIRRLGELFVEGPQLGTVVQAYLKDSYEDLRALVGWSAERLRTPLQIRLVKGAYWDFETVIARAEGWPIPVFEHKAQTDANYERCIDHLLDRAGDVRPAFASHNIRSLAYALAAAKERGLPDGAFELQVLYGMAEPIHAALRELGMRVRAYTPVGELVPGMAYLVRRLLENTSNESFLRHRFVEGQDLADLIAPPDAAREGLGGPEPPAGSAQQEETTVLAQTDALDPSPFRNEPHAEFRRQPSRARVSGAVAVAPGAFPIDAPVLIDGQVVRPPEELVSVDPGDFHTVVCRSGRARAGDADRAVEVASAAFEGWRRTPVAERAQIVFRAAGIMRRRRAELAALEVYEAGKPWAEADADVTEAIDFAEYYGREALRLSRGAPLLQVPGESNALRYVPRGPTAVIAPWNFPLAIPTGMVTAPLVCGNPVLLKPAEQTPGIAFRLAEILHEAGLPPGVLAFLPGLGEEVGEALVEHPGIVGIAFTGSKPVGLGIIERAGIHRSGQRRVKHVVAEMGGKNAIVVDTDADLDVAVPAIVKSAFAYAGQKCSAASRVIAVGGLSDELAERIVGATKLVPVGHAREMRTQTGPVIDEEAYKRIAGYQELAHEEGEVLLRREDVPNGGWYVGPTVMHARGSEGRVVNEEIFGPLLALMEATDLEEAIALANAPDYGLTAGVFSRSPSRIRRATDGLHAHNIYVNRSITGSMVGRQAFGGIGLSGVGPKAGGPDYLYAFCESRVVTENTVRQGFAPLEE